MADMEKAAFEERDAELAEVSIAISVMPYFQHKLPLINKYSFEYKKDSYKPIWIYGCPYSD